VQPFRCSALVSVTMPAWALVVLHRRMTEHNYAMLRECAGCTFERTSWKVCQAPTPSGKRHMA
jgi:hypothetical protein